MDGVSASRPKRRRIPAICNPIPIIYGVLGAVACQQQPLRAARANLVFGTNEKHIRTKNKVMDKSNNGLGLPSSEILDCARICFSSVRNRGSARTGRRPREYGRFFVRATAQPRDNGGAFWVAAQKRRKFAPPAPVPGSARPVTIRGFQKTDDPTAAAYLSRGEAL